MAFGHLAGKRPPGRKTRTREGLHLRPLNVEKGEKRFSSADDSFPPQAATWRNNLIALSQRRNLLFVAYSHQIYVWEPAGSFQMLGSVPLMIITPVMKEPNARGFISPNSPHAINNILVDDLGREEVLLLVTDSGNVCGYRTEAIFSALARAAEDDESRPLNGSQVDPFFVEYVEASAWGLAIHKFARLIAVSANTGLITVFAFALVNPISGGSSESSQRLEEEVDLSDYGQTWLHITTSEQFVQLRHRMPEKHRTRNIKLTYTGHFANIPSVSFLNCDLDPNGTWMVSTDIDNKLLVWKIWDGLGAFNMYHFNDIGFRSFHDTLRNDERGWSVIALDPRSFHLLKSTEEACGGRPQRRVKDGQPVFDLTKLSGRVPNASQIYNYFPPAVKAEPERPVLPDIFDPGCRISKESDTQGVDRVASSDSSDAKETNHFHANAGYLRPSDSADAFSHRAVDGSVYDDNMSHGSSSELNLDADSQQTSGMETTQQISDSDHHTSHVPPRTRRPPQTTPEFLQVALLEALGGGDMHGAEEYFDGYSVLDDDSYTEDEDMNDIDLDQSSDDGGSSATGAVAYQVFDRMSRNAFPEDAGLHGRMEALIGLPPTPAPVNSRFPILHFSQTDIRLVAHPFAPHASVVCGAPLRQPFTHPIVSIRACDRFNMVKYVPEHGIVVAASQKGRAAIIALTESEAAGLSFRVDWIVPFESQEKYGDRPLIPLLGMSVSPIQGFEMPPDVPYIPRDVDENNLTFRYQHISEDDTDNVSIAERSSDRSFSELNIPSDLSDISDEAVHGHHVHRSPPTLPECHARATRAYQPEERWRGWNPSRRYRLLLMYADHTVMSYEFWYNWNTAGTKADESDEDEFLVV